LHAAEILDLTPYLKRKPKALSGGQRQRVAMGRAIVRKPKVFLMDEPLSNLDAKLRVQMRTEIAKLHQELGTTIIYVTHDQTEAMTLGTRIVVMKDGLVQQIDTPQNLYNSPKNQFVAGFIGSPQMNFLDAKIIIEADKVYCEIANKYKILVPQEKANNISKAYDGRIVTLGIRPEDIKNKNFDSYPDSKIEATLSILEQLGAVTFLYCMINDTQIVVRINPDMQPKIGEKLDLAINNEKIHLFDKETQQTITN
jgi:multiple sugar transport system ATP-binding protein